MSRLSATIIVACFLALPASAALRLQADVSERTVRAYDDDQLLRSYEVAVGSPKYPTPTGQFTVRKVVWNPSWVPPDEKWARGKDAKKPGEKGNPMKVAKIFFKEPDYYLHGTGDLDSLGDAASHGCIRMHPDDVADLAKLLMEYGGKPMPEPWYRRILHRRSTKVIYLSNPIPIVVEQ